MPTITQIGNINTITAINDNLQIEFTSTNSNQPYFKFIFDLYINGSFVSRFKKLTGEFCPSDILLSYINYDYLDELDETEIYQFIGDQTCAYWTVEVGEEFDVSGTITEYPAIITTSTYFSYYGKSDLVSEYFTHNANSKWISCVNEIYLNRLDNHFIYIANSLTNLATHIAYSFDGYPAMTQVINYGGSPAPSTLQVTMLAVNALSDDIIDNAIAFGYTFNNYVDIWLLKSSTQITEKYRIYLKLCDYDTYTFLSPVGNWEIQKFKTNNKIPTLNTSRLSYQNNNTQKDFFTNSIQSYQKFTNWLTEKENTIFKNFFQSFKVRQQINDPNDTAAPTTYLESNIIDSTLIEKTNYNDGIYSYAINLKESKQLINK